MATNNVIPNVNVAQWYNGNYEVIHGCMAQLCKAIDADQVKASISDATTSQTRGFWSRFWGRSRQHDGATEGSSGTKTNKDDSYEMHKDDASADGIDLDKPSMESDSARGEINHELLERLKVGAITGFREWPFHRPHMIPRRTSSFTVENLRIYIRSRFPSIERSTEEIDAFSAFANVDQELCCHLLYEGICFYGDDSQTMPENMIIQSMLHLQSGYQLKCLMLLFSLFNSNMTNEEDCMTGNDVFPECVDILRELVSKDLIKNLCLLLMAAIKEASRYNSLSSKDDTEIGKKLYDHSIEVINSVLRLLDMYYLRFHPLKDDVKRMMVLIPHVFSINRLLDAPDYNNAVEALFQGIDDNFSAWYPPSANVISFWMGIKEFDETTNNICNISNRLSLILMLSLNPHHYRLSVNEGSSKTRCASLMLDSYFLDRFQVANSPFLAYKNLNTIMEFIVFGMYINDIGRVAKCFDIGVFEFLGVNMIDSTNDEHKDTVIQVLDLMMVVFLLKDGALSKNWYDIMDYEIRCKRNAEELARIPFTGNVDERIYRHPGKSLMDILNLLRKFGKRGNKDYMFHIWKNCTEIYRSVVPDITCHIYKSDCFQNKLYRSIDNQDIDKKNIDKLTLPCKGFSWWERNSALLELVTLAASDHGIYIETYPLYLTCLLEFGIYLSLFDNIAGEPGGKAVGRVLSTGASRELRFPFLLEHIISQIGTLTKGHHNNLHVYIYKRLLARDDQIETAEAALNIASSIPAQQSQHNMNVGGCLRRMYTFPFISCVEEVKVALSTLGLGGSCPFGLIETSIATFQLISKCDRIPRNPSYDAKFESHLNVNIQYNIGGNQSFVNAIFSILSRSHVEGMEMITSSVLSSLCTTHIRGAETASAALSRIAELIHDGGSILSRGFLNKTQSLTTEELGGFMQSVNVLFVYIPHKERFKFTKLDWLHRLVEFALWILDVHCLRNKSVDWGLISSVLEFLLEVAKGPIDARGNTSKGSQYLLEQLLVPASSCCMSLVRAAKEAKLIPAISIMCILFKRDVLLLMAHRVSLVVPTRRKGERCLYCGLQYSVKPEGLCRKLQDDMDVDMVSNPLQWWANKIRKINSIFSSSQSHAASASNKYCDCLKIEMRPVALIMAHDAISEAMNALRGNGDHPMDASDRCDFIGYFTESAPEELKIKCVYILLQMQERMGVESLVMSGGVIRELQRYYSISGTCEDLTSQVMYHEMEAEDLILYNKLTNMASNVNRMECVEHRYYCMSHLSDLNRCGLDNMILFFLKQCALKSSVSRDGNNVGVQMMGLEPNIVALIKLASGGSSPWRFSDFRRMDALASLLYFARVSNYVARLIGRHWRNIEDEVNKVDFQRLNYESYIIQCQRLSCILELLVVLADRAPDCVDIGDITPYVKLYSRFVDTMCEVTMGVRNGLKPLAKEAVEGEDGMGVRRFLTLWKSASFQANVCVPFNIQLSTKFLNPEACESLHEGMKNYALRVNCANMMLASSTSLICSLLNFISHCSKFNIVGLSEKARGWLELASAGFNAEDNMEMKLGLRVALIKQVIRVWLDSTAGLRGNDSMLAISVTLKLIAFILTRETSKHLRSKIYACVNLLLTSQRRVDGPNVSELLAAHLLSQSLDMHGFSMLDRTTILQMLFEDATSTEYDASGEDYQLNENGDTPNSNRGSLMVDSSRTDTYAGGEASSSKQSSIPIEIHYNDIGLRQIFVGDDYSLIDAWSMRGTPLRDIMELETLHSNEMVFIAADNGVRIDYRLEALVFFSALTSALHKFEATAIEYDLGTLSYGSLGVISTEDISAIIRNRLLEFRRCRQCALHSPCCPPCIQLLAGTARALKAVGGLQQFSTFWFHVQPTSQVPCLADQFLSCDILLGFNKSGNIPTELFHPFISILENLLGVPSIKTRNSLIKWLNRHSEILATLLIMKDASPPPEDKVSLICSLLRIYRVCTLWLLADYRTAKFKSEQMTNFSLVMADLQCKFPLAVSVPRVIPVLLEMLTGDLLKSSDVYWQCVLLCLQTIFPELGGFEADLDFSMQTPIMTLALEKAPTIISVLTRCGINLLSFINKLSHLSPAVKRAALSRFALRASTVECAATLLEYILALVLTHSSNTADKNVLKTMGEIKPYTDMDYPADEDEVNDRQSLSNGKGLSFGLVAKLKKMIAASKVEIVLEKIAIVCHENGGYSHLAPGNRRKHGVGEQIIEHLAPYDLEHVASFGNVQQYKYSYKSLYTQLLISLSNISMVLQQYYGCRFSSQILSYDQDSM
ncbi:hypothetical protein BgAZ_101780 [Babesia gibsoni]|uniref:Uncharacterized protein n=1 Tax=Babesia gibsoni TaxID=33632 RepID=A0AAD8PFC4_BABGI|nr:hypothetical protein BgAZ_101780 [Babesia gibsoni]